jgi:DNA-directed RNA polymerase specialized sigma24 family protein
VAAARLIASRRHDPSEILTTEEEDRAELVRHLESHLVGHLLGALAETTEPKSGEDECLERDDWARAVGLLVRVLDELQPAHRELLLLFAHGHDIKEIAAARGADYSTVLDHFHRQIELVRARLRGANILETPKRPADAVSVLPVRTLLSRGTMEGNTSDHGVP